MPIRKAARATRCRDDVDVTLKRYHSRKLTAAGRLRFFSGGLLRGSREAFDSFWGAQAASPPQDGFAVVNLLVPAARRNELCSFLKVLS
jgi:hypothetical protein